MKIFGIAGWSGSGKTTLITRLIPVLTGRGLVVATLKHSHHDLALAGQSPGAVETLVVSPDRFAILHDNADDPEPKLAELLGRLGPVDLVLVEGFKSGSHPKIEVWDPSLGKPLLAPSDSTVVAVVCDQPVPLTDRPIFTRNDIVKLAEFAFDYCGLAR